MKFQLDNHARNVPDEELLSDVKRVAEEIRRSPTLDEYSERGKYHATTLTRRFGSWFEILSKLNLKPTRSPINISNEDLFQNLEEVWANLGRQPRYEDIQKPLSKYSAGTYEKRFGTWREALEIFVEFVNSDGNVQTEVTPKDEKTQSTHKTKRNINWRLRFVVLRRDDFKCQSCGKSPANNPGVVLHVDHINPWSKGGETVEENLQTLCSKCNVGKSDL